MNRKLLLVIGLLYAVHYCKAQNIPADSVNNLLKEVFISRQAKDLFPVLSGDFSIGVYTGRNAKASLQTILKNLKVDSLVTGRRADSADRHFLPLKFYSNGKDTLDSRAWLNEKGEILYVDLFDHLYKLERYGESVLVKSIPFEVEDGSIILTASINRFERPLRLLFDTGADGMALSKSLADSIGLIAGRQQSASVVGGRQNISISENNSLFFDSFEIKRQSIGIFDQMGLKYDGIVGNVIAREYIIKVDYDRKRMDLYSFGKYNYGREGVSLPIAFTAGLIELPAKIKVGKKMAEGDFIFDTGAGYYLIAFGPFVRKNLLLTNGFVPWFNASTVSMGHSSPTFTGAFDEMDFGKLVFTNFPGTLKAFMPGDDENGPQQAGSLGIKIISRYNFILNLADKMLHLEPNHFFNVPMDFMLGKWYMGFNDKHEIIPNFYTEPGGEEEILKKGDAIILINGISSKAIEENPEKLKAIQKMPFNKISFTIKRDGKIIKI